MDDSRKAVIRKVIEKRIAELERILARSDEEGEAHTEQLSDEATRFDALANISVDSTLLARARSDLTLLRRQWKRIDHNTFGLCRLCGAEISANRICSIPATEFCIACAQQQEKRK